MQAMTRLRSAFSSAGSAALLALLPLLGLRVGAQSPSGLLRNRPVAERPALFVLGTVHLDNPGRDVVNTTVDDVLAPGRQAQIGALVERLTAFRPTRIAVEWDHADQAGLDQRYRKVREGSLPLGRSEVDQIALRLASRLGLPRVDAIDWNEMPPGREEDFDFLAWAEGHGAAARVAALRKPAPQGAASDRADLMAWLKRVNAPEELARSHRQYFDYLLLGDGNAYPGANWVGNWFTRNLKILTQLVRLDAGPKDRILVVYGAGHAYRLRRYAEESGAFRVEDPLPWLKP